MQHGGDARFFAHARDGFDRRQRVLAHERGRGQRERARAAQQKHVRLLIQHHFGHAHIVAIHQRRPFLHDFRLVVAGVYGGFHAALNGADERLNARVADGQAENALVAAHGALLLQKRRFTADDPAQHLLVDGEIAHNVLHQALRLRGGVGDEHRLALRQNVAVNVIAAVNGEAVVLNRVDGARNLDIRKAFALKGHGGVCLEPAVNAEILHRFAIGSVQCRVALHINIPEGFARQAAGNHIRKVRHAGHAIGDAAAQDGHQAFL